MYRSKIERSPLENWLLYKGVDIPQTSFMVLALVCFFLLGLVLVGVSYESQLFRINGTNYGHLWYLLFGFSAIHLGATIFETGIVPDNFIRQYYRFNISIYSRVATEFGLRLMGYKLYWLLFCGIILWYDHSVYYPKVSIALAVAYSIILIFGYANLTLLEMLVGRFFRERNKNSRAKIQIITNVMILGGYLLFSQSNDSQNNFTYDSLALIMGIIAGTIPLWIFIIVLYERLFRRKL